MGAVTEQRPRTLYVNFKEGQCRVYDSGVISTYPGWSGYITGFGYKAPEPGSQFGTEFQVHLKDGNEKAILQMPLKSGAFMQFAQAIENVDLTKRVVFYPWFKSNGDKKMAGVNLFQEGKQVAYKYSNKEPNGMPEVTEEDDGTGQMKKNARNRLLFLRNIIDSVITPKVKEVFDMDAYQPDAATSAVNVTRAEAKAEPAAQAPPAPIGGSDEDDLPF